ncbi:MAG TPA: type II toxin-antitoxin system HipA family toxin [Steroidobacteraceae bacterium]|nr:type II toxin-antitoxin system HipA family toxin [Steroidobacteraceae bacterium]
MIWMNGERVGEWTTLRTGTPVFRYERTWAQSPNVRSLSLSLPITADREVRGDAVDYYFDNLLPDSTEIRRRIRTRFQTRSTGAFDLLSAIGRDCAGAVQLLPPGEKPDGWNRIDAKPLSPLEVEATLREVTVATPLGAEEQNEFRISLAGAQEKTALLRMGGKWFQPLDATPTTHILKLPLGTVGNFQGDFSDSVENEWLCGRLLRELGFQTAASEIARFGKQRVLVVTRFDRRWIGVTDEEAQRRSFKPTRSTWIARLPQEDFCQAFGLPPTRRYESEGGPSIESSLSLLAGSESPDHEQSTFLLVQLSFWLLAAIDGHGKNFSIFHRRGGTYGLTPIYDVLSAWPVIGHKRNELALERAKMAMAIRGRRPHYRIDEITGRHWRELADRTAMTDLWSRMQALVDAAPAAFERLEAALPAHFPEHVFTRIRTGVVNQARRFKASAGAA